MYEAVGRLNEGGVDGVQRLRAVIGGAVQGVGFRPFIYRLANEIGLTGWVENSPQGVFLEVEGKFSNLRDFLMRVQQEKPPHAFIQSLEYSFLDPRGYDRFEIRASGDCGDKSALILPDIATCSACLEEIFDPNNRRYLYPFTNCTHCGPRYTIIEKLPYDRSNTTLRNFQMCDHCREEYENPLDRRFHAQPNACPECGPHLELWDKRAQCLASHHEALLSAAAAIRRGEIVAVKGIGGFHLVVDARNEAAVQLLRERKHREEKPLALMFPSLRMVKEHCDVSPQEERLLLSPECPIVLLHRRSMLNEAAAIASNVAPANPCLGVMLPYSPLHHILMRELGFPIVATSGNLSDEPICTDENDALQRLKGMADLFLVHDRPIALHCDDSVVRIILGRELVIRRARGYAPLPIRLRTPTYPVLAVGGHLKNSVAVSDGYNVFMSQHVGDLETMQAYNAFLQIIDNLENLRDFRPKIVACDQHPDYLSTRYARRTNLPCVEVQHHYAHILSCMAENELDEPVLGVAWDGTGYGSDGTIWGGEFLEIADGSFQRVAHFRTFPLPGGEKAIEEPRRCALGLLYAIYGDNLFGMSNLETKSVFSDMEWATVAKMLVRNLNCPITSSAGRLFDALASLLGIRQINHFEGQAAMELEFLTGGVKIDDFYPIKLDDSKSALIINWEPAFHKIIEEIEQGVASNQIAARFHNTLVQSIVDVAHRVGMGKVVLSGGCFQNKYLTERTVKHLQREGFRVYFHQRVPPNDGGIALGQIVAASLVLNRKE